MSRPARDMTGERFGRLVVVAEAEMRVTAGRRARNRRLVCECDCGNRVTVFKTSLVAGRTVSCGCRRRELDTERPKGAEGYSFVGDAVGYSGLHTRLREARGRAASHQCALCGEVAQDWAYRWDKGCPGERLGEDHGNLLPFCLHEEHYDPMCKSCHKAFDLSEERSVA